MVADVIAEVVDDVDDVDEDDEYEQSFIYQWNSCQLVQSNHWHPRPSSITPSFTEFRCTVMHTSLLVVWMGKFKWSRILLISHIFVHMCRKHIAEMKLNPPNLMQFEFPSGLIGLFVRLTLTLT